MYSEQQSQFNILSTCSLNYHLYGRFVCVLYARVWGVCVCMWKRHICRFIRVSNTLQTKIHKIHCETYTRVELLKKISDFHGACTSKNIVFSHKIGCVCVSSVCMKVCQYKDYVCCCSSMGKIFRTYNAILLTVCLFLVLLLSLNDCYVQGNMLDGIRGVRVAVVQCKSVGETLLKVVNGTYMGTH